MEKTRKDAISAQIIALGNENKEFVNELAAADSPAAVQETLKKYNIDVTIPEVEAMYADGMKVIENYVESADGELGEGQLEDVAGGGLFRGNFSIQTNNWAACGYACLCSNRYQTCGENPTVTRTVSLRAGLRTTRYGC